MITDDLIHLERVATSRDPMTAKVGYHSGDSYGCDRCQFKWFDSVSELVQHILTVELVLFQYDREEHEDLRGRLEPILSRVTVEGFTEEMREAFNKVDSGIVIFWWGRFHDLLSGKTPFSREIVGSFAVKMGRGTGVQPVDMPAFLEFLPRCCLVDRPTFKALVNESISADCSSGRLQ